MQIIDLYSGIGGFSLAGDWVGWRTIQFCELDKWCQKVLKKHWPSVPIHDDINTLTVEKIKNNSLYNDKEETIITGGVPCQPASTAGKRLGEADNRWLWPQTIKFIGKFKPTFAVLENVAGLVSMENGKTLEGILSDLENEGYEVESFIIPACGVGAWHRRDRIWIVAYNNTVRCNNGKLSSTKRNESGSESFNRNERLDKDVPNSESPKCKQSRDTRSGGDGFTNSCEDVSDSDIQGSQRRDCGKLQKCTEQQSVRQGNSQNNGNHWELEPDVGRVANGIPRKLDKIINYEIIRKELFELWQKDDPTRMEKWTKRFNIQEQEILQLSMLRIVDRAIVQSKENEWKKDCSTKIQINRMREMWIEGIITEASQRRRYKEQFPKQHTNIMSDLSQGRTPKEWDMGCVWNEEPNTPRVSNGVRDRVNRLKGLGNAIVPQVAFELFKAIEQLNQTL